MMSWHVAISAVICFLCLVEIGNSYRILGVFPTASISHQVVFRALTLALNKRGHELVIVTTDPVNDPALKNYTEIDIHFLYNDAQKDINFVENRGKINIVELVEQQSDMLINSKVERILDHSDLRKLYAPDSNEKFDLLMVELLFYPGVLPLAKRFDVPVIGMTTLGLSMYNQYNIGNPTMISHLSNWELEDKVSEQLSLWQRFENFVVHWKHVYWYKTEFLSAQTSIAKKYFGNDIPNLDDLEKNVSLIFVNQQGPISYVRPNIPKVIEIGGFHVTKQTVSLPKDLKNFLDEATGGFVYMSLGSNAKSTMLSVQALNEFKKAFSRLPYKVLWKFEDDILPGKPDNVYIMKWVPQQAVLAHPNLKVFIYQGGLQSTEEAVAHAVPLVGFPVLGDQEMQVRKMVSLGVAIKLEITAVDGNTLYEAINTVASDSRYKQRMLNLRLIVEDKPYDPLENAIWWTEYVIRHGGAPHLHSSTADEPWYIRQDMDIVAFISAGSVIILSLALFISYQLVNSIRTHIATLYYAKAKMS